MSPEQRKIILITIVITVLIALFQVIPARSIDFDYKTYLPLVIYEPISTPEILPAGDYISRSGEWVVTFTEPQPVIKQEFADGYIWFFIEISYKNYPSITAWVRKWDVDCCNDADG